MAYWYRNENSNRQGKGHADCRRALADLQTDLDTGRMVRVAVDWRDVHRLAVTLFPNGFPVYSEHGWLYIPGMHTSSLITVDRDILGGTPVFRGTRVPVKTLFDYLANNYTMDEFLECFPTVTRAMARQVLEDSETALFAPTLA